MFLILLFGDFHKIFHTLLNRHLSFLSDCHSVRLFENCSFSDSILGGGNRVFLIRVVCCAEEATFKTEASLFLKYFVPA